LVIYLLPEWLAKREHEMAKKKNAVRIRMVVQWINRKLAAKGQILMATRKMKMKQLWQRSAR
jgi:hypothetical protein